VAKGRVLIVDDDELDRRLSTLDLEHAGYIVSEAGNVDEALKRMERQTFDVLVLDIVMPGTDGLTFLRALKASSKTEDMPIVMLTAMDDIDNELQAMSGGAISYITKPSHRDTLVQTVANILEESRGTRGHPSES
jgi:CheY-like chemotaxis protein